MKKPLALFTLLALVLALGCSQSGTDGVADASSSSQVANDGDKISDWVVPSQTPGAEDAIVGEVVQGEIPGQNAANDLAAVPAAKPTMEQLIEPVQKLFNESRFDEAIVAAHEVRKQLPDDPRTLLVIANIAGEMGRSGNISGAIEVLETLPESQTDRNLKMELLQHYQQGSQATEDKDEAIALIQKATAIVREIGMDQPWAKLFLFDEASLLSAAGRQDESAKVLRESYEAGYEEYVAPAEVFADNPAASKVIDAFAPILRERYSTEIREELLAHESFPFAFELTSVDGQPVSTEAFKGKVAIVDFWGTWCPPCRMEIPHFVKLAETYADDLAIVGLNYREPGTEQEQAEYVAEFLKVNEVTYPCAIGDEETARQVPQLGGFPTTLFLDRSGKVRLKLIGYHPYEKLEAAVQYLADEEYAAAEGEAPTDDGSAETPS